MAATGTGDVRRGNRDAETVVYIPSTVHGSVTVTGAAALDTVITNPDGSRDAYVAPDGTSMYGVEVGHPGTSQVAAVEAAASSPLPPITEPQARQLAEQVITQSEQSSNPTIAGNAAVASSLATLLLGTTDPAAS
jgi:hypothetical protein